MIRTDNSNRLPILTAASFILLQFPGASKGSASGSMWGPRMDLRHCFPARDLSVGSRFLLHWCGAVQRKPDTFIFTF